LEIGEQKQGWLGDLIIIFGGRFPIVDQNNRPKFQWEIILLSYFCFFGDLDFVQKLWLCSMLSLLSAL